jgi:hypothetical protein
LGSAGVIQTIPSAVASNNVNNPNNGGKSDPETAVRLRTKEALQKRRSLSSSSSTLDCEDYKYSNAIREREEHERAKKDKLKEQVIFYRTRSPGVLVKNVCCWVGAQEQVFKQSLTKVQSRTREARYSSYLVTGSSGSSTSDSSVFFSL